MKATSFVVFLFVTFLAAAPTCAVTIPTVPIGNPGNPADTRYDANGIGSVPYSFRMGKTEVTNAQYVEFLNAVAASDPYGLYNANMASDTRGGIVRSGVDGSYSYAAKSDAVGQGPGGSDYTYENKPVVFASWYDAIRFANWLHNGQGSGDTETGAYTLGVVDANGIPFDGESITRNPNARWWLPSEDEWYKAAYYDPIAGAYYDYPTGTNSEPNNNLPSSDTGNSANFSANLMGTTGNASYPLTDAGAYKLSASPYGTFDQVGNVWEWNEVLILIIGSNRGLRGASWANLSFNLPASFRHPLADPTAESFAVGFRVATVIPEPSTILLGAMACVGLLLRKRR